MPRKRQVADVGAERPQTREALILAAMELFGEYGFKATSTRMLAERSGANISAIPYYFGSKEGLYKAVMEYIIERIGANVGRQERISSEEQAGLLSVQEALVQLKEILLRMARLFVGSDEPKSWARILVRELSSPTDAFNLFYDKQIRPVQETLKYLVAVYLGVSASDERVKIYVHALMGQIQGFLIMRENLLRHLGVARLSAEQTEVIYKIVLENAENILKYATLRESVE